MKRLRVLFSFSGCGCTPCRGVAGELAGCAGRWWSGPWTQIWGGRHDEWMKHRRGLEERRNRCRQTTKFKRSDCSAETSEPFSSETNASQTKRSRIGSLAKLHGRMSQANQAEHNQDGFPNNSEITVWTELGLCWGNKDCSMAIHGWMHLKWNYHVHFQT